MIPKVIKTEEEAHTKSMASMIFSLTAEDLWIFKLQSRFFFQQFFDLHADVRMAAESRSKFIVFQIFTS